jgi:hypothetical protein
MRHADPSGEAYVSEHGRELTADALQALRDVPDPCILGRSYARVSNA